MTEAKGLGGRRRSTNLGTEANPRHAQQGTPEYLDGTLEAMRTSGDPVRSGIARKLQDARAGIGGFKVVYLEVATKQKAGGLGFTVTYWIE